MLLPVSSQGVLPAPQWPVMSQTCYSHETGSEQPWAQCPTQHGLWEYGWIWGEPLQNSLD